MPNPDKHISKREQQRQYRKRHKAIQLTYTPHEMAEIETAASKLGMTRAQLVKACVHAHIHGNGYVVPNKSQVREAIVAIHRIGNVVNQLVRYCHQTQTVTYTDIQILQRLLSNLSSKVHTLLTQPPRK